MKVEFKGGRDIESALESLDVTTTKKRAAATRALRVAAEPIRDEWVNGVDVQSGDLKRSIKIGNRAATRGNRNFRRGAGEDIVEQYIGIDPTEDKDGGLVVYAYIEEFGKEGQPANPAGRRAWEAKKMAAFKQVSGAMWAEIERAAKLAAARTARLKK